MGPSLKCDGYFRTATPKQTNTHESREVATGPLSDPTHTQQNTAAMAAIAAAVGGEGESKENTLLNKTQTLIQNMEGKEGAFWEAALYATYFYHIHPLTRNLTEREVTDWRFWLPMDLFEWRWKKEIKELFPWWEFTHNTDGHYVMEPDEYICPEERWKVCETTLRQPTFHTMYNLPNNHKKITYWDVFGLDNAHFEVREFIIQRGCPKDLEVFVWCWAEDDRELNRNWQKWGQRGIEDHIVTVAEKITGVTMEECMKKDTPPPMRRQATWVGKFYEDSDACPPRERVDQEGDDTLLMVEVRAPKSLLREWCYLEMDGTKDNPMWKQKGLPAGLEWMVDIIWANLTPQEREKIKHELMYWQHSSGPSVSLDKWLHVQLLHNFGDCFTEESKRRLNWMLIPRDVTW